MVDKEYMLMAFEEAQKGVRNNTGGPFGAVVVFDGKVVGKGCNMVTSTNDPSAHAGIVAIREACSKLGTFHLTGAEIYATCEPCPMCMSAIYWADIKEVYYCSDKYDAERIGFGDKFIYDELSKPISDRSLKIEKVLLPDGDDLFKEWINKNDRIHY
jgi:guanine deaminase